MLPKTSVYLESYNGQTKLIYFLIEDDELLKKYNTIWDKINADIKSDFDSEPVYNEKFLKTKMKSYGNEAICFRNNKISNTGSNHTFLSVITIDSIVKKKEKNYYSQVFLTECKHIVIELIRHITEDLEMSSRDFGISHEEYIKSLL